MLKTEIIPTKVLFQESILRQFFLVKPYYDNNNVYLYDLSKSKNINTKKVRVIQKGKTTTSDVSVLQ